MQLAGAGVCLEPPSGLELMGTPLCWDQGSKLQGEVSWTYVGPQSCPLAEVLVFCQWEPSSALYMFSGTVLLSLGAEHSFRWTWAGLYSSGKSSDFGNDPLSTGEVCGPHPLQREKQREDQWTFLGCLDTGDSWPELAHPSTQEVVRTTWSLYSQDRFQETGATQSCIVSPSPGVRGGRSELSDYSSFIFSLFKHSYWECLFPYFWDRVLFYSRLAWNSLSQTGLELEIFLPQPLECCEYKHEPPHLGLILWYSIKTIIICGCSEMNWLSMFREWIWRLCPPFLDCPEEQNQLWRRSLYSFKQ